MKILTSVLDGKRIAYSSETEFLIQLGKDPKGSYRTIATFKGNLAGAVTYYNGLAIHSGWKKRLLMPSCTARPVLAISRS